MSNRPISLRIRAALAAAASVAVLAGIALPGAASAAGSAPLIDGSRPAPSPAAVTVTVHAFLAPAATRGDRPGATRTTGGDIGIAGSPGPCADRSWNLLRDRPQWRVTYRWSFRARSTPTYLERRATVLALRRGVANITGASNDCGRSDRVSATASYLGTTGRLPAPNADLSCAGSDGHNVIGFGRLPARYAALTCIVYSGGQIIEADIKLNKRSRWATSLTGCVVASLVEAVTTHEVGHAFGLDHVSEANHGRLTMSERLDGHCQNSESTLGKGDMLGLEAIY